MRITGDFFSFVFRYDFKRSAFLHIVSGIVFCVMMSSCNWFRKEKVAADELVRDEIRNINWNEIDQYPLFESCDETADKAQQKTCFENTFIRHLYAGIEDQEVVMHGNVDDTIYVRFLISRTGQVSVAEIEQRDQWEKHVPDLDSIVRISLDNMPGLHPALKRNIPVTTKYRLPIVLQAIAPSSGNTP